jgi:hypothetical protein
MKALKTGLSGRAFPNWARKRQKIDSNVAENQ